MATHLRLDDKLIETARKLGGHKTKREAVIRALQEYVQRLKQQAIVSEFGKIDYDPKYDYKKQRKVSAGLPPAQLYTRAMTDVAARPQRETSGSD